MGPGHHPHWRHMRPMGPRLLGMPLCVGVLSALAALWPAAHSTLAQTIINVPPDPSPISVGANTVLNLYDGGMLPISFDANDDSTVNIEGGNAGDFFDARSGSTVIVRHGRLGRSFEAFAGATVRFQGGVVGDEFSTNAGAVLEIFGASFELDGVPIAGLDAVGDSRLFNLPVGALLTGILTDGTPFAFSSSDGTYSSFAHDTLADDTLSLRVTATPPAGPQLISLPVDPVPSGIRAGQTVHLEDGGVLGASFAAGKGSIVQIAGGSVGENLEAVGAQISMASGTIGPYLDAFAGTTVNVSGGTIGSRFEAFIGSTVVINDGVVEGGFTVHAGSNVSVAGGVLGDLGTDVLVAESGSNVMISGGSFADGLNLRAGSHVTLVGAGFKVEDVPVPGLTQIGDLVVVDVPNGAALTGVFADGTSFAFVNNPNFVTSASDRESMAAGTLSLRLSATQVPDSRVINIPGDAVPLRAIAGQTLNILSGGTLGGNFNAGPESVVNISGGFVGGNFEAVGSQVNLFDGTLGAGFDAFAGSVVNIRGGTAQQRLEAHAGSTVNILGGEIGSSITATAGASVSISAGATIGVFDALGGSTVTVSGGRGFDRFFHAYADSVIDIVGTAFTLEGVPIQNLVHAGDSIVLSVRGGLPLSSILIDGNTFDFDLIEAIGNREHDYCDPNATLRLTLVYAPGDANFDGRVDIFDVNVVSLHWGEAGPAGDTNSDGIVDMYDVNLIGSHWFQKGPAAAGGAAGTSGNVQGASPVPEPASIALFLLAALCAGAKYVCRSLRG